MLKSLFTGSAKGLLIGAAFLAPLVVLNQAGIW